MFAADGQSAFDRQPSRAPLAAARLGVAGKTVVVVVCLSQPAPFRSVGTYYADFHQVDDDEVIALLDANRSLHEA